MSYTGKLHVERGGSGDTTLLLLHGLGANSTVWKPMLEIISKHWEGRWIAPDFRGHGLSPFGGKYGFADHASDIADILDAEPHGPIYVVGHSFGGVVGAVLSIVAPGTAPQGLFAFGVKLNWTPEEVAKSKELAKKPRRIFAERDEAIERFLKGAGLFGLLDPASKDAAAGVVEVPGGWAVRLDPMAFNAVGPDIPAFFRQVQCPFRLSAGDKDRMVTLEQMRQLDPEATVYANAGHNVHFEHPGLVWQELSKFVATQN